MGMFIEVESVEKNCTVIINLDAVIEVAPLRSGGCEIKMQDDGVSKSVMRVKNDYSEFKQFAMHTVSSDDIARRIDNINRAAGVEPRRGPGRPPKVRDEIVLNDPMSENN